MVTLTNSYGPVHVSQCMTTIMHVDIFEEHPELHLTHDKCVVRTLLVAQGTIKCVDPV